MSIQDIKQMIVELRRIGMNEQDIAFAVRAAHNADYTKSLAYYNR